jgi:hypothetical protein
MSSASNFKALADSSIIYEVIGNSGAVYVIFWFPDGSVCAARRLPSNNNASARLEFQATKPCLDDCSVIDVEGTTYQKGQELIRRIEGRKGM